jgi:hypothetical protein
MVEQKPSKLTTRVRFSSPALHRTPVNRRLLRSGDNGEVKSLAGRLVLALTSLLLGGVGVACNDGSGSSSSYSRSSPVTASLSACPMTVVHYTPRAGTEPSLGTLPWVAVDPPSSQIIGHLFYYARSGRPLAFAAHERSSHLSPRSGTGERRREHQDPLDRLQLSSTRNADRRR